MSLYLEDRIEFKNCIEFMALFAGLKPVVRITGAPNELTVIENVMRPYVDYIQRSPMGLTKVYANDLADEFYRLVPGPESSFDLMVTYFGARDRVGDAIHAETTGCGDLETARTLGYPACCANNYSSIKEGQHWVDSYFRNVKGFVNAPWQANKIAFLFPPHLTLLPDYFPCSVTCEPTVQLALTNYDILCTPKLEEIEKLVKSHLTGITIIAAGEILLVKDYTQVANNWIEIHHPFQRLRFDSGLQGLPRQIRSVRIQPGELVCKTGGENPSVVEMGLGESEGGVLFI